MQNFSGLMRRRIYQRSATSYGAGLNGIQLLSLILLFYLSNELLLYLYIPSLENRVTRQIETTVAGNTCFLAAFGSIV